MLELPSVTLVCVETRAHKLAAMAIEDCLRAAKFGDVVVLTDCPRYFAHLPVSRFKLVEDWPEKVGWSRSWWFDVPPLLRTSHTLNIQWDSWICDPSMWREEFLEFDYIGAPWWYKDGRNVGNGGFSLVSSRLKRYVADRRWDFPCDTAVDDDLLCRQYRPRLEAVGFKWAPEWIAHDFAFECCRSTTSSFGFHAMANWPSVLDHDALMDRVEIALDTPGIRDGFQIKSFRQAHPGIVAAVTTKDQTRWPQSQRI